MLHFYISTVSQAKNSHNLSLPLFQSVLVVQSMPWGDGSLTVWPQDRAGHFYVSIGTLSLPELSVLSVEYKEKNLKKEKGRWG